MTERVLKTDGTAFTFYGEEVQHVSLHCNCRDDEEIRVGAVSLGKDDPWVCVQVDAKVPGEPTDEVSIHLSTDAARELRDALTLALR